MRYDITDLQIFLHIAEEQNLTRGAARSHISAAAASARIKSLEENLGCALLERRSRGMVPTLAGQIVLDHARRCLAGLNQLETDLVPFSQKLFETITMYAPGSATESILPGDLMPFLKDRPFVRIVLEEKMAADSLSAVLSGRAELAVLALETEPPTDLDFVPYAEIDIVAVVGPDHPFSRRPRVRFAECLDEPLVLSTPGITSHSLICAKAASVGKKLDVRITIADFHGMLRLVAGGIGLAFSVAPRFEERPGSDVVAVPLEDAWCHRRLYICTRPAETSPHKIGRATTAIELAAHLAKCGLDRTSARQARARRGSR